MNSVIEVKNLCKQYSGNKVVDDLSFNVGKGEIVGLIGPNGAGKSTTMKIILGLIKKDSGAISIDGKLFEMNNNTMLCDVGFTSESPEFYMYLSGFQNLRLIANMYPGVTNKKIDEILEYVGLKEAKNKKVKAYSTGMKQRLGIARTLISNPKVIILDEPTNGLDPQGMKDIYNLIRRLANEKQISFIISSHLLHDIERICNNIVIINKGKTIFNDSIEAIYSRCGNVFMVELDDSEVAKDVISKDNTLSIIAADVGCITLKADGYSCQEIETVLRREQIKYHTVKETKPTLEDLFFIMMKEGA